MNKQEVFDLVCKKAFEQGWPSIADPFAYPAKCAYRGADGRKCFIGHLIKNKDYSPAMEGHKVTELLDSGAWEFKIDGLSSKQTALFLQQLQVIHDEDDPAEWEDSLWDFAVRHALDFQA